MNYRSRGILAGDLTWVAGLRRTDNGTPYVSFFGFNFARDRNGVQCILVLMALEMCFSCLSTGGFSELAALRVDRRVIGPINEFDSRERIVRSVGLYRNV